MNSIEGMFPIMMAISAVIGWAVIELVLWLMSFITISFI